MCIISTISSESGRSLETEKMVGVDILVMGYGVLEFSSH
jgi:hypothetical protein